MLKEDFLTFNLKNVDNLLKLSFWHRTADEVETWRKYGTPFLLMITHGGKANTAGCKIICNEVISKIICNEVIIKQNLKLNCFTH